MVGKVKPLESAADEFQSWREARAWLHGRRAFGVVKVRVWDESRRVEVEGIVEGFRLDYAPVRLPDGRAFQYAWGTVANVVRTGSCLLA